MRREGREFHKGKKFKRARYRFRTSRYGMAVGRRHYTFRFKGRVEIYFYCDRSAIVIVVIEGIQNHAGDAHCQQQQSENRKTDMPVNPKRLGTTFRNGPFDHGIRLHPGN